MSLHKEWSNVHSEEIDAVNLSRIARMIPPQNRTHSDNIKKAHAARLTGLSFSGGGIRSATFNLGILQGLANLKIMHIFDYLSTVSGGGYIGSWLNAWIYRSLDAQLSPDFKEKEFEGIRIQELCAAIEKDVDTSGLKENPNTVKWLNELLADRDLFQKLKEKNSRFELSDKLLRLQKMIAGNRDEDEGFIFSIKCLNRLILEEYYETKVPACREKVVDKPTRDLNRVVRALNTSSKETSDNPQNDVRKGNRNSCESEQVGFLRQYSNYLTPRRGFSTDTVTLGVAYTLNFVLNLIGLVMISCAVFTLPLIAARLYAWFASLGETLSFYMFPIALILLMIALSLVFVATNIQTADEKKLKYVRWFVILFLLNCVCLSMALWKTPEYLLDTHWYLWAVATAFLFCVALLFGRCLEGSISDLNEVDRRNHWRRCLPLRWEIIAALVTGLTTGPLLYAAAAMLENHADNVVSGHWLTMVWGMPMSVLIYAAATILYSGITGRSQNEYLREWTFRLWALLAKYAFALVVFITVAVFGPLLLMKAETYIGDHVKTYLTIGWLISTIGGVLAGKNSGMEGERAKKTIKLVVTVAPYLFIIGLVLMMSWGSFRFWTALLGWFNQSGIISIPSLPASSGYLVYWHELNLFIDYWFILLIGSTALFGIALLVSYRVGVNEFSLHAIYGNRLVRAYLGASNQDSAVGDNESRRDPFTFFNTGDSNVRLSYLSSFQDRFVIYPGPFPIINTTLNLMESNNLAWQKRKGASFIFSALYSGYDTDITARAASRMPEYETKPAYVRSHKYSSDSGVSLGKAMTISGAAASPNMGYFTSAPLAFLMTVFNLRLGWWLVNPVKEKEELLKRNGPTIGIFYQLIELFAKAGEKSDCVYLSDGGHFENLGIYELVKRRCRYIVACDAAQDREMKFNDLGNAIEKCRTDFGIDILIDVGQIYRQDQTGYSVSHCAVGKIRYSDVDGNVPDGTLIYIKSSLTGDEPLDIDRYSTQNQAFPHQSTADQWFDETQFESYRRLGEHIAHAVFGNAVNKKAVRISVADEKGESVHTPATDIERLFHELREQWYPPCEGVLKSFNRHASKLEQIFGELKKNENLQFLTLQFYPVLDKFEQAASIERKDPPERHVSATEMKHGFYMCKQMLVFMESVYHDLNLDKDFNHPDNRGWTNLFRRWAWSSMFRFTWAVTVSSFGARFQKFCEQRMNFRRGQIKIDTTAEDQLAGCEVTDKIANIYSLQNEAKGKVGHGAKAVLANFWKTAKEEYGFNDFEQRIIEDLLKTRPKPCSIIPIYLKIEDSPLKKRKYFYFNVGFMILETSSLKQPKMLYFRIQNHLRRMGLARRSLRALLKKLPLEKTDIIIEFIRPSAKSPEVTSTDDRRYFNQLLQSVKNES